MDEYKGSTWRYFGDVDKVQVTQIYIRAALKGKAKVDGLVRRGRQVKERNIKSKIACVSSGFG